MYEQILWWCLVPSGVIYLSLIVLTFTGFDVDIDLDMDGDVSFDGGDMHFNDLSNFLSFRNAVNFTFGYSSGGLIALENGLSIGWSIGLGLGIGFGLVLITVGLMFLLYKLREINVPSYDGLVGKTAKVYLIITNHQQGKITVMVKGSQKEMYASADTTILTGETVIIEKVENGIAYVVKQ